MRVLMLGWEFPPYASGGLGTACHGLTKALQKNNIDVTFVMPKGQGDHESHANVIFADKLASEAKKDTNQGSITFKEIDSLLQGYIDSSDYARRWYKEVKQQAGKQQEEHGAPQEHSKELYGRNLYEEVQRYAERVRFISDCENFDVIHAHDWMTYPAAVQAKEQTKKPLVLHIHATEFDRTADNPNQAIFDIEREGLEQADTIVAVSEWTRKKIITQYGISPEKVEVVHNAVEFSMPGNSTEEVTIKQNDKVVLFLGRLTLQKGPEHFLWAARKAVDIEPNIKFVIAGKGDMESRMVEETTRLGLTDRVIFTGFLGQEEIDRAYRMADLYVMPSLSEPFGITPLESLRNKTPVLISRQSGVSEILRNCLTVDFWDINQMANKMVSVLRYQPLQETLSEKGHQEVLSFSWNRPAKQCARIYQSLQQG